MISITAAVTVILYLIVGGLIFGLLYYAIYYCEKEFPGGGIFWKFARIVLVLLAVFVIIGILLSMFGGQQLFRQ
jgi:Trk-type K+ transport system membrane component